MVKRGVGDQEAYQSAVGMLASDEGTQSNGLRTDSRGRGGDGVMRLGSRCWREVVVRFVVLEERGPRPHRDWSNVEQWALDQKSPRHYQQCRQREVCTESVVWASDRCSVSRIGQLTAAACLMKNFLLLLGNIPRGSCQRFISKLPL